MRNAQELTAEGARLQTLGDTAGARFHYLAALRAEPEYWPAIANHALILMAEDKLEAAVSHIRLALRTAPQDWKQWTNLGNAFMRLERFDEAEDALEMARDLAPDAPTMWYNLALLRARQCRHADARDAMLEAIALGHNTENAHSDLAHFYLALRDLDQGLREFEYRWYTLPHQRPWDLRLPEWQGEPLNGKTLLLHSEQGYGDAIMLLRLVPILAQQCEVVLALPKGLLRLAQSQCWKRVRVVDIEECAGEGIDLHSPMYSALRWLGLRADEIDPRPYIKSPAIITPTLSRDKLNIGLCFASGKWNADTARRRLCPLHLLLSLTEIEGVQLYSLQKGPEAPQIQEIGAEYLIRDITGSLEDWADTAAFISKLDLVITVDTAVAHLAGSMGIETWMMGHYSRCWRWWNANDASGLPWYENFHIFQQYKPGDWKSVVDCMIPMLELRTGIWNDKREAAE